MKDKEIGLVQRKRKTKKLEWDGHKVLRTQRKREEYTKKEREQTDWIADRILKQKAEWKQIWLVESYFSNLDQNAISFSQSLIYFSCVYLMNL